MSDPTHRTVHLLVKGRVQGVGYRAFVEMHASRLDLNGWVRNRLDGSVEAVFQGPAAAVEEMLALCRSGPPSAEVTGIEIVGDGVGAFDDFEVKPTV